MRGEIYVVLINVATPTRPAAGRQGGIERTADLAAAIAAEIITGSEPLIYEDQPEKESLIGLKIGNIGALWA